MFMKDIFYSGSVGFVIFYVISDIIWRFSSERRDDDYKSFQGLKIEGIIQECNLWCNGVKESYVF